MYRAVCKVIIHTHHSINSTLKDKNIMEFPVPIAFMGLFRSCVNSKTCCYILHYLQESLA